MPLQKQMQEKTVDFYIKNRIFNSRLSYFFHLGFKTLENKGLFALSVFNESLFFFECMENARQRLWLFGREMFLPATRAGLEI